MPRLPSRRSRARPSPGPLRGCPSLQDVYVVEIRSDVKLQDVNPNMVFESVLLKCKSFAIAQYSQAGRDGRCFCWDTALNFRCSRNPCPADTATVAVN